MPEISDGDFGRKLVMRLVPIFDETLPSYVDRLGQYYGTTLKEILTRLGFMKQGSWSLEAYGITLDKSVLKRFAEVAGLAEERVSDLLLDRYHDSIVSAVDKMPFSKVRFIRGRSTSEWAYSKGSHFCPECLQETCGAWLNRWRLPWSFACVRHASFLCDTCPACGKRPRSGRATGLPFLQLMPAPMRCDNSCLSSTTRSAPCGYCFDDVPLIAASPSILDVQKLIEDILNGANESAECVDKGMFFGELESVCAMILYASELEDFDALEKPLQQPLRAYFQHRQDIADERGEMPNKSRARRLRPFCNCPTNSRLMAAVVQKALVVVRSTTEEELARNMKALAERVYARGGSRKIWSKLDGLPLTRRLRSAFGRGLSAHVYFDRKTGFRAGAAEADTSLKYTARNVPQLFQVEAYNDRFRPCFPEIADYVAREFCSMAAVKRLGLTWANAARALELPARAHQRANYIVVALRRNGAYELFADELLAWAKSLSASPTQTDYQLRRDALRAVADFSEPTWAALHRNGGVSKGRPGKRSRYCAAWMWADATGGDWRNSPAFALDEHFTAQEYRRTVKDVFPAMASVLRAHAAALIDLYSLCLTGR